MQAHADDPQRATSASPDRSRTAWVSPSGSAVALPGGSANLLQLQRLAGNRAVSARFAMQRQAPTVQRDDAKKSLDEVLKGTDPDELKPLRPFPALTVKQLRDICRLVIDHNHWVGPDDEKTLEGAWRAVQGERSLLTESDWKLWAKCEDYGAEIKSVPWMYEAQTTFAEHVRAQALKNVDNNVTAIRDEAKRLGIAVDGAVLPPSQAADEAVVHQRVLATQIQDAHDRLKQLRTIPVGYAPRSWGTRTSPPGGLPDDVEPKKVLTFDPEHAPDSRPETYPDPDKGIASYETIKALHDETTRAIAVVLEANPALYALAARGGADAAVAGSTETVRAQMATALQDVLTNAATSKANIESGSLRWVDMFSVYRAVQRTDPLYQAAFEKKLAEGYIAEEGGADAAAGKALTLLTIALITAAEIASGGTATPVIAAVISLAASGATAAASWDDWAKLETAAKSTVSDKNAIVTQEQADTAQLGALISTAMAIVDVYGVGKAVRAASAASQGAVKALEGRVSDAARLKELAGTAAVADGKQLVERSIETLGAATTVRNAGSWQKLTAAIGAESPGMGKLTAWRDTVFKAGEAAAATAAKGAEGEAARAALAVASGISQAALGEAIDAVIEVIDTAGADEQGQIHIHSWSSTLNLDAVIDRAAAKHPIARTVQRDLVKIVHMPISELRLATMNDVEFEQIIRGGVASGYFAQQGLPRMTVLDGKIHGGGHGYDGLGISKQGRLIQLYNLECKHVSKGSVFTPALWTRGPEMQGDLTWSAKKAQVILNGPNPFADETREDIVAAVRRRVGNVDEHLIEQTLAEALASAKLNVFTTVWAKTEELLAQMHLLGKLGVPLGKLIRVAPRR